MYQPGLTTTTMHVIYRELVMIQCDRVASILLSTQHQMATDMDPVSYMRSGDHDHAQLNRHLSSLYPSCREAMVSVGLSSASSVLSWHGVSDTDKRFQTQNYRRCL